MVTLFEIEGVFQLTNRGYFIAAKCLEKSKNFKVTENSKIGNVDISQQFNMPRALDKDGNQRLDLFFFGIKNEEDKDKLKQGEIVKLTNF